MTVYSVADQYVIFESGFLAEAAEGTEVAEDKICVLPAPRGATFQVKRISFTKPVNLANQLSDILFPVSNIVFSSARSIR